MLNTIYYPPLRHVASRPSTHFALRAAGGTKPDGDIYFEYESAQTAQIFLSLRVRIMADDNQSDITALTVQLLSAFVSNNSVPSENLAELIRSTRAALTNDVAEVTSEPLAEAFTPAISVRKSLSSPDHILSLIDGKPYKTLKRHLAKHGLTPEQYRERYNLPSTYPMVAQSYSAARRAVAEKLGLGKKPAVTTEAVKPVEISAHASVEPVGTSSSEPSAPNGGKPVKARATAKPVPPATEPENPTEAKDVTSTKMGPKTSNRVQSVSKNSSAAKREPRKRLSIAAMREETSETKTVPAAKKTEAKAKPGPKSKSVKVALEAANAHLNSDAEAVDAASKSS